MGRLQIAVDPSDNKVVVIPELIFKGKQNIDWGAVEDYLQKYIGEIVTVADTKDVIYIGKDFPDEFKGSNYTKRLRGANAKAKANAAQGIVEMLEIASDKRHQGNRKEKHRTAAANGWYYYTTRFAMPVYEGDVKTGEYNIYTACLLVNQTLYKNMYLYDLVDIKKEARTPLKIA